MKPQKGDWDYIRPWYVRMWDGPVMTYLMWRSLKRHQSWLPVKERIKVSLAWGMKYL